MADDWEGRATRSCGEHRTVGYRAWCYDDGEWCYPSIPCHGCETFDDRIQAVIDEMNTAGIEVTKAAVDKILAAYMAREEALAQLDPISRVLMERALQKGQVVTFTDYDKGTGETKRWEADPGPFVTKTGKVLTDDEIQELADEADRGYDVDKIREVTDGD